MGGKLKNMDLTAWNALRDRVADLGKSYVKVGVIAGQGAETVVDGGFTLADLAAVHEFGSRDGKIPQRSFIRRTFEKPANVREIKALVTKLARGVLSKQLDKRVALEVLGQKAAAMIKATIFTGPSIPPRLAQATIDRKHSDRALVDTGRLGNSMTHKVVIGGGE